MTQYPSLARLLRPGLLPAYEICAWLVSGDERLRRSGRSSAMAAAFLREGIMGRTARIWDHAAGLSQATFLQDQIRGFADQIGLTVKIDGKGVLREVDTKDPNRTAMSAIAGDDGIVLLETLRRTVENMLTAGVSPEAIIAATKKMAYEKVVQEVHDL